MTLLEKRNAFGGPRGKVLANVTNLTLSKYERVTNYGVWLG
jgi:hypothetical protein